MADNETAATRCDGAPDVVQPPQAEFFMELRDSLPDGRAIIGVEQEGRFTWLAAKDHVSEQARDEMVELLSRIVREGWWVQNWQSKTE